LGFDIVAGARSGMRPGMRAPTARRDDEAKRYSAPR
jgi:hypothetical protein